MKKAHSTITPDKEYFIRNRHNIKKQMELLSYLINNIDRTIEVYQRLIEKNKNYKINGGLKQNDRN
jgi:hypothetical protein